MKKMKASFIGIMPYDLQGEDKWNAIKELGKIGFKGSENVEGWVRGEDGKVDPELLKRVKSYGIEPVDVAAFMRDAGMDVVVEAPDDDTVVVEQLLLGQIGLVLRFLKPVSFVAPVP